jgi:hypothetical protein
MRKLLLITSLLFAALYSYSQATTTVGSSSGAGNFITASNVYGPMTSVNTGASWNRHAYIYPASLLAAIPSGSIINAIDFSRVTSGAAQGALSGTVNFKIYLKNSSTATYGTGSLDWATAITGATLIYDGDPTALVGNTPGFKTFNATSSFSYTGSNLEILVEYSQSAAATGEVGWGYDNATTVAAYADNQVKYITGTSGSPTGTLSTSNQRHPGLRITFTGPACGGTPTAGTSPANRTICGGTTTTLTQTGATAGAGIIYQWQQSATSGGSFTDVTTGTGGTSMSYTTAALSTTTYYRLKVTCTNSSQTVYGGEVAVTVTTQPSTIPVNMGFNTTSSFNECLFVSTVTNVGTNAAPAISFATAGSTIGAVSDPTVNPQEGDRMIRFNSYNADAGDQMRLVFPTFNTTGTASLDIAFWVYEVNGADASTDNVVVQYSADGLTWTTAPGTTTNFRNTSLANDGSQNAWARKLYTLPAAVGNQSTVYVGLLFTSAFGYHSFVDNVTLGASGTFPVTYLVFKGERRGTTNHLEWVTATEANNKGFELERSADGTKFSSIGFIATKAEGGNSTSSIDYSFTDNKTLAGTNYYRLRQVDKDGRSSYSSVVKLKGEKIDMAISALYPNPAKDEMRLAIVSSTNEKVTISITDLSGKEVKRINTAVTPGDNNIDLNVSALSTGTYYLRLISATETKTTKFIKN